MTFGIKSKKGNAVIDGITVIVILFCFATISIVGYFAFSEIYADMSVDADLHPEALAVTQDMYDGHSNLMDNLILMAFVLFTLFTILSAFMLDTHPIFFIISVILLVAVFVVAGLMANVFDDVMSESTLAPYANEFVYTSWIMGHLLEVSIAIVFMVTIAMFIKFKM